LGAEALQRAAVKAGIQKNGFLLEFIPMEIGAGMTKGPMWPIAKNWLKQFQLVF
jgi:hypothetical protein